MKNIFIFVIIISVLLFGCSPSNTSQGGGEESSSSNDAGTTPEPAAAPALIGGNLEGFLPAPNVFPGTYASNPFEASNESIVNNWGGEYQGILDQTERLGGTGSFYVPESDNGDIPASIFVVIESFASVEGSAAFFAYDFPEGFRKGIYKGESIKLGSADEAILATLTNPNGDDPNAMIVTITFRYKNVNAIVEGSGTADNLTFEILEPIALSVLEKLEVAH